MIKNKSIWLIAITISSSFLAPSIWAEKAAKPKQTIIEESFLDKGNNEYKKARFDKAYVFYKKALEKNENKALSQFNMANCLYQMGQAGRALIIYEKVRLEFPQFIRPYVNAGGILFQLDQMGEAIVMYHKALEIDPNNLTVLKMLGESYLKVSQKARALEYFDRGWTLEPTNTSWLYAMTDVYLALEDYASARDVIVEALKQSDRAELWFYKAEMEVSLKKLALATQSLGRGLELDPKNASKWYRLAQLHQENNSSMLAILTLKEGIASGALGNEGLIELADAYFVSGDATKAMEILLSIPNAKTNIELQIPIRDGFIKMIRKIGSDKNKYLLKVAENQVQVIFPNDAEFKEIFDFFKQSN